MICDGQSGRGRGWGIGIRKNESPILLSRIAYPTTPSSVNRARESEIVIGTGRTNPQSRTDDPTSRPALTCARVLTPQRIRQYKRSGPIDADPGCDSLGAGTAAVGRGCGARRAGRRRGARRDARRPACATAISTRRAATGRRKRRSCSATKARASCARSAPAVTSVAPGDHVVLCWAPACGVCPPCREGRAVLCDRVEKVTFRNKLPSGASRLHARGQDVAPFLGTACFSELHRRAGRRRDPGAADAAVRRARDARLRRDHRRRRGHERRARAARARRSR